MQEQLLGIEGLISGAEKFQAAGGDSGGGGLMGSLTSMAGSLLGGKAKGYAGIISALTRSGLSADKIPQYSTLLVGFLKEKLGSDRLTKSLLSCRNSWAEVTLEYWNPDLSLLRLLEYSL